MRSWSGCCALVPFLIGPAAFADELFEADGQALILCECVQASSGCASKVFNALAGNPTHSWHQEINVHAGMRVDLNDVCYRKRNVDDLGAGMCCEAPGNERHTVDKMFRASVRSKPTLLRSN